MVCRTGFLPPGSANFNGSAVLDYSTCIRSLDRISRLSDAPLLSLEQISVGGRYSVRGYRENTLLRDQGILTSLETRLPVVRDTFFADYLELAQFFDFGRGWNRNRPTIDPKQIYSVGAGLRWALTLPRPIRIRPPVRNVLRL